MREDVSDLPQLLSARTRDGAQCVQRAARLPHWRPKLLELRAPCAARPSQASVRSTCCAARPAQRKTTSVIQNAPPLPLSADTGHGSVLSPVRALSGPALARTVVTELPSWLLP